MYLVIMSICGIIMMQAFLLKQLRKIMHLLTGQLIRYQGLFHWVLTLLSKLKAYDNKRIYSNINSSMQFIFL